VPAPLPGPPSPDGLLTPGEVARLFRVDPKTVTAWAKEGRLDSVKTLGGHRRFSKAQISDLLNPGDGPVVQALEHARGLAADSGDHTAADHIAALITTLRTREPR